MDTNDTTPVEVPRQLRRCAGCAHLDPAGPICRRKSPTAIPTPGKLPGAVGALTVWPPVNPERDWCGEWTPENVIWGPNSPRLPAQD